MIAMFLAGVFVLPVATFAILFAAAMGDVGSSMTWRQAKLLTYSLGTQALLILLCFGLGYWAGRG